MTDAPAPRVPIPPPPATLPIILRSAAFTVWLYGTMVAVALAGTPLLLGRREGVWGLVRGWVTAVEWGLRVIVGCRIEVRGREHIPTGGGLIAAKHMAMLDTIVPLKALPDAAFVFKQELSKLPFWGWYMAKLDNLPVDRKGGAAALRVMVRGARERMEQGRQILIFPEGTRAPPGAPADYKPGVAGLYRELGTPVTPLATNSGLCWPPHGFIRRPGVIVYAFLPPIPAGMKRASFMAVLEDTLEAASDGLIAEELARRAASGR